MPEGPGPAPCRLVFTAHGNGALCEFCHASLHVHRPLGPAHAPVGSGWPCSPSGGGVRGPLTGHPLSTRARRVTAAPAARRAPAGGGAALGVEGPCLSLLWGGPLGRVEGVSGRAGGLRGGVRWRPADAWALLTPQGLSVSAEQVHRHLDQHEVRYLQFAFRWMNNLLMRELPLRCAVRLWDTYQVRPTGHLPQGRPRVLPPCRGRPCPPQCWPCESPRGPAPCPPPPGGRPCPPLQCWPCVFPRGPGPMSSLASGAGLCAPSEGAHTCPPPLTS